jgi:hypothetical protein
MNYKLLGKPLTVLNNYKKIALYIPIGITCTKKCIKESIDIDAICLNENLYNIAPIETSFDEIFNQYSKNCFVESIVLSGLEPFDTFDSLINFVHEFRQHTNDDIVIYTGYNKNEIQNKINTLKQYENIIVKFGRYIKNSSKRYDQVLGVELVSSNQYAEKIS